jgi:hypothetical protein
MKCLPCLTVLLLIACGGTAKDPVGPGGSGSGSAAPAAAGDVTFELPKVEIKGVVFEPDALGRPGMPLAKSTNRNATLVTLRKAYAAERDIVLKQAHAAVIATMLYEESKKQTGAQQTQTYGEARQILRDVAALAKDKVDEVTLRMLGSYELQLEDYAAAEKAWEGLVQMSPKAAELAEYKAWWCYSLLRQGKNAEALAAVKSETLSEKQPLLAYAAAWAKWRNNDDAGAWQALGLAATGWGTNPNREVLDRDVLLFAGRSAVPFAQVQNPLFAMMNAKVPADRYNVLARLGLQSYQFAGRWTDGVAALDEAVKVAGATIPPNDKLAIAYYQADFTVRLDTPEVAARHAKDAVNALSCPTCSAKDKQDVVMGLWGIGRLFHLLYATSNDLRYYAPAHEIYELTIPKLDATTKAQVSKDLDVLEKTLKNMKAGTGVHEAQAMNALLQRHNQEIQACYEDVLAGNTKLGGELTLELESDATGAIKGVNSEPKAGAADLAAVASCAVNAAKTWKLPKRGMPGSTRIKIVYALAKK